MPLRPLLVTAHLCVGVALAPLLCVLGVTGAILVFQPEVEDATNAALTRVDPRGLPLPLAELGRRLAGDFGGAELSEVVFPGRPDRADRVVLALPGGADTALFVDPYTAAVRGATHAEWTLGAVHRLHTKLAVNGGSAVVGWTAAGLLFLCVSGLTLWWPGKIFSVVRTGSRRRVLFHLHNALGFWAWGGLLVLGATGVAIHWGEGTLVLAARATGVSIPPPFPRPGARCAPERSLDPDRLLALASAAAPGARVTWLDLGAPGSTPIRVAMKYPEDHTPAGRTNVFLDRCSGAVVSRVSSREAPVAYRAVRMWNRELHTGDILGWPTRVLAALASLSLPLVATTGPLLWLSRRRRRPAGVTPVTESPVGDS
jgi:uncharacterized iron-regulated membrane protein